MNDPKLRDTTAETQELDENEVESTLLMTHAADIAFERAPLSAPRDAEEHDDYYSRRGWRISWPERR